MEIKEATKKFVKEYLMTNKHVFGVWDSTCKDCGGHYIEVHLDNKNRESTANIPNEFEGYEVKKTYGEMSKAQKTSHIDGTPFIDGCFGDVKNSAKDSLNKKIIKITKKGYDYFYKNVPVGGTFSDPILFLSAFIINVKPQDKDEYGWFKIGRLREKLKLKDFEKVLHLLVREGFVKGGLMQSTTVVDTKDGIYKGKQLGYTVKFRNEQNMLSSFQTDVGFRNVSPIDVFICVRDNHAIVFTS